VLLYGIYRDDTNLSFSTVGGLVYPSDTTAGGFTQTQPSATDHVIQPVGVATATAPPDVHAERQLHHAHMINSDIRAGLPWGGENAKGQAREKVAWASLYAAASGHSYGGSRA